MEEREFNDLADAAIRRIEDALEINDVDYEVLPGGVLQIEPSDGSRIIVNRHAAMREIWVAARSGGFHFRHEGGRWVDTRSGEELMAALSRLTPE